MGEAEVEVKAINEQVKTKRTLLASIKVLSRPLWSKKFGYFVCHWNTMSEMSNQGSSNGKYIQFHRLGE